MSRERSPYIVGDYWLAKRRDGRSPDIWQVASYNQATRAVVYRSTKQRSLDAAKAFIRAFEAAERSKAKHQPKEAAQIVPHLFNYLREQGPDVKRLDTIKSSFRAWIGYLQQHPTLDTDATIADIDKNFVTDFRRWRMGKHEWEVEWDGKTFRHSSEGVSGKAVMRNIEDLRAALHHAEENNRIEAPKVVSIDDKYIQKNPREALDLDTLGAIYGYAKRDPHFARELWLMLGTAARPGAAMRFDPSTQWHGRTADLRPERADLSDKRAAVVPIIEQLYPILSEWKKAPHDPVKSRKRTWRTMRRVIGLPDWVEAYNIRTTVATHLENNNVPIVQVSGILGHLKESRGGSRTTTKHYLSYDPTACEQSRAALGSLFDAVMQRSNEWSAVHLLSTPLRGKPMKLLDIASKKAENSHLRVVGADGLEPPTLSV